MISIFVPRLRKTKYAINVFIIIYENIGQTERHLIDDHKAVFTFSNQAFNESEDFFFCDRS